MAGKRAVRLRTVTDVSVFLAKLINEVRRGEVDGQLAGRLGYLSNILIKALETDDLEQRVDALEERIQNQGADNTWRNAAG